MSELCNEFDEYFEFCNRFVNPISLDLNAENQLIHEGLHSDCDQVRTQSLLPGDHNVTQLSRSCFMHIRDLRRIRPMLDLKTASATVIASIVHAKLNHCNSLFLNIDVTQLNLLQAIRNALARAVTKTPKHHHFTPVLKTLQWLKIPERIEYKVISLTYNTLQ